ncbi:hypothetical protein [Nocardia jiangsuensis]|uniref:Cytochrome c oxidase assembly protein n=1 Tax=Nocardia jiangsuensis TaxID=1691563 RepID=A0ABV8DPH9_9NOCA
MLCRSGRGNAGAPAAVARVRGAAAGALSACLSVAAHGWAAARAGVGLEVPGSTALVLLFAAAAVTGALIAGAPALRESAAALVAALGVAQVLGHAGLGFESGHLHGGDLQLTPAMLAAHAAAVLVAALLVHGTGAACRAALGALARALPSRAPAPPVADRVLLPIAHRDRVVLRVFARQGLSSRGPPLGFVH